MRSLVGVVAGLLVVANASVSERAHAETPPTVWERARDPAAAVAYALHEQIQHELIQPGNDDGDQVELERAKGQLLNAGAEKSRFPLLRFDLAEVYDGLKDHARAAEIYKALISEFPDAPILERAWLRLAFACGHLGDHVCERDSYVQVLKLETEEVLRATPTLNLAETQMHMGDLKGAIEGYREALRIAGRVPSRETAPLATWGLAVALDRTGDRTAAEKEARFALELERSMGMVGLLRSKDVFFVPPYEIYWYEGLGEAARARGAASPRETVYFWSRAEMSFEAYVKAAEPKQDRWLPIAKARLAEARRERQRAEKSAPREPGTTARDPDVRL